MGTDGAQAPKPYGGDGGYIFISYAHQDRDRVLPLLAAMTADGFRLWFDEGVDPGTEWDENIAVHIEKSGYFIALISADYLRSENCRDELNYARDLDKRRVLVYLEQVPLPAGMAMRLNRLQAIHAYACASGAAVLEKLYAAAGIGAFRGGAEDAFWTAAFPQRARAAAALCRQFAAREPACRFLVLTGMDLRLRRQLRAAMEAEMHKNAADYRCVEMPDFVDELIEAIHGGGIAAFRRAYKEAPRLILEDVEFLAGKSATQETVYEILKDRYYHDRPTMLIASRELSYYGMDERIAALAAGWEQGSLSE